MTTGRINQVKCENSDTPLSVLSADTMPIKEERSGKLREKHTEVV